MKTHNSTRTVARTAKIDPKLDQWLEDEAKKRDWSKSQLIYRLLQKLAERERNKVKK